MGHFIPRGPLLDDSGQLHSHSYPEWTPSPPALVLRGLHISQGPCPASPHPKTTISIRCLFRMELPLSGARQSKDDLHPQLGSACASPSRAHSSQLGDVLSATSSPEVSSPLQDNTGVAGRQDATSALLLVPRPSQRGGAGIQPLLP